ncbi:MAG: hypothetical protein V1873_00080 [Verrucomicrobiota bacterium]
MKPCASILLVLLLVATPAAIAWDYYQFDLPSQAPEAYWRDVLAEELGGQHEVSIEGGRIDVLTDTQAIEIDWPHKWHEGLGQALHYSDVTGKQGVLALISYSQGPEKLQADSRARFDMVEKQCAKHGIKVIVLFPSQPKAYGTSATNLLPDLQQKHVDASTNYWLNTKTRLRHRPNCRYYGTGVNGRPCGAKEGKACALCGGG